MSSMRSIGCAMCPISQKESEQPHLSSTIITPGLYVLTDQLTVLSPPFHKVTVNKVMQLYRRN